MAMTKKDFEALALSISARYEREKREHAKADPDSHNGHYNLGKVDAIKFLAWDIANLIEAREPNFNKKRFIYAALGYVPHHDTHPQDLPKPATPMERAFAKAKDRK